MKMTKDEILTQVKSARSGADNYAYELKATNDYAMDCYNSEPWNEIEGRSKVKTTDVYDVVEAPLPSIISMFLSAKEIHKFAPDNELNQMDVQEAEEKTEYVNYLVKRQKNAYQLYSGWMKNALIRKHSVLTYEYVEDEKVEVKEYVGISEEERLKILFSLSEDNSVEYEVKKQEPNEEGGIDLTIKINRTIREYEVRPVDSDSFFISRGAKDKDDAEIIGHDELVRRGDLVAQGYDEKIVNNLPRTSRTDSTGVYYAEAQGATDKASDLIIKTQVIIYLDADGDGIPERRKIVYCNDEILEDEPFDHAPYAILSANLMPFEAIGKSLAEVTTKTEEVKTTLLRGILDNTYMVNSGRIVVNTEQGTNIDDLTTNRHRGIIRTKGDPRMGAAPLDVPFVGDKVMSVIQYMDFARSQRTGTLMATQGLNSDSLREETATRFAGVTDEGEQKTKLIARNFAETGWRHLFEGLAWLVAHYQNDKIEIAKLGKPLTINPAMWRFDHRVNSEIGLGSGDDAEQIDTLMALYQIQVSLLQLQSPTVDHVKIYKTLSKALKTMGHKQVSDFFNNPEVPQEMTQQTIETLNNQLGQALQMIEQTQQNPLAEAEQIRAQAKLLEVQIREQSTQQQNQIDAMKAVQDQRQWAMEFAEEQRQFNLNMLAKLNEIEAKTGKELTNQVPKVPNE